MWQHFTERARFVILHGQAEAGKMNSTFVETEHLLLGLILEKEGIAAQILQKHDITLDKVRQEITSGAQSEIGESSDDLKLSPKAKRTLELAADEARHLRHNDIDTEHLLLALLREKDGVTATLLCSAGMNFENTRAQVLEQLGQELPATPSLMEKIKSGFSRN